MNMDTKTGNYGHFDIWANPKTGFSAVLEAHSRNFFRKFVIVFLSVIDDVP